MMRPHFSTEKVSFSNQAEWAAGLPFEFRHSCVCHHILTHFSLPYRNAPSFFYILLCILLSHHVILFLAFMSIPLHLPWFCLCLQYFLSRLPTQAAAAQSDDAAGSWTGIFDVKDSSPFCPPGPSLNYWCKYVAETSLMQAVALKWKHDMSIKCDLCVIIIHMPSDRGEKWLAN